MYPFTRNFDYLQLLSHQTCEDQGLNYKNIRSEWHNLNEIDRDNIFTSINTGQTVSGTWLMDGGDESLATGEKEKRAYCRKGKATFTFTGTSVSLRIYANPLYGEADIRIDGVKPSTLSGVTQAMDVVSCDAYDIEETWGEEYLDITLASNISDTTHTVEVYAENPGSGVTDWFCIAGYKVNEFSNKARVFDCFITPYKIPGNKEILSFINSCDSGLEDWPESIYNLEVIFGSYFVDYLGNPMGTAEQGEIEQGGGAYIEFYPNVQGSETEHQEDKTIQVTAEYENPNGAIERNLGDFGNVHYETEDINYDQWWWADGIYYFEAYGETYEYPCGIVWALGEADNAELTYEFFGTFIKIQICRIANFGNGGIMQVYVDDVHQGEMVCRSYDEFPDYYTFTFDGLSNEVHTLKIIATDGGCDVVTFEWNETRHYTEVVETITYNYNLDQIPPFAPIGPRFEKYNSRYPTCTPVNLAAVDYNIPRINVGVDALWLDKRVATFAVCYQAGFEDILKTYDIVIVEPKALTRDIVKGYQALGIKVICYCSYGEEVGTYENEWDASSDIVPHTGDGQGVGGYASYYNKGGNQFGECSECKYDRRRLESVTECALEKTGYYAAGAGRCSNACTKDYRLGYETYILGSNCNGGYNKNNYWSRTATKACTNSDCPAYDAVNDACPYYESPDETMYGQDYSMSTSNWPDENGIWKSFYTNPIQPAWNQRFKDCYLPTIFDEGIEYDEEVSVDTYQTETPGVTVDGFKVEHFPIDSDEYLAVRHIGEDYIYTRTTDYIFDKELGIFKMQVSSPGAPPAPWGTQLEVTYTRKGLEADGIFLDTLDTVDVYTSDAYREAMVNMISEHHALYPDKIWAMNRGFTILEDLMLFTNYVMFETFITSYNWDTGEYYEITDEDEIAANQVFIDQLFDLRADHKFNVLGLNYCAKDDDALKQLIAEKTRQYGWLSWNSEISLTDPQENEEVFTKDLYIESNAWRLIRELPLP